MKIQISFDLMDLEKALNIASKVYNYADILEVGTQLIYKEGIKAVQKFKENFPNKIIFADAKVVDRVEEVITLFSKNGADIISMLAGADNNIIQKSSSIAHKFNTKIALDLLDAYSAGQSALDAKNLNIDLIICHRPHEPNRLIEALSEWQDIRDNTPLPIFIAGGITRDNIEKVMLVKPQGVVLGSCIIEKNNPEEEIIFFNKIINRE